MQIQSLILTSLALAIGTIAAPGQEAAQAPEVAQGADAAQAPAAAQAGNWEFCNTEFWCDTYDQYQAGGCYTQPECMKLAKNRDTTNYGCGGGVRPYTCWVYTD